jgi:hypothetical protein
MHCKPIFFSIIVIVTVILSTVAGAQVAQEKGATINELTATTSETHLIVFGTLENSFTSEMIELLHSGIPLRFSFYVELYKATENWREELITTNNFQHIITFDTLKDIYKVTLEEDNNKILSFKSLFEAQKQINEINGVKVVELNQLLPDNRYKLKMKAELYRKTLPLSLHNILPFLSWWDIETDWHTLTFTF